MKDLIVVLSYDKDGTANDVLHSLYRRGARALMLNTGDFPSRVQLDASFLDGHWQGTWWHHGERYALEEVKSVLYRRPTHYEVDATLPEQLQAFAENETSKGFGGILRSLPCFWVSHQDALRATEFKPRQLQRASQLGVRVPRTLITNDPTAVRRFYETCAGKMIYKTLHGGNIGVDTTHYDAIFTSLVLPEHLKHLEHRIPLTANLLQEVVEKAFELRVTVVGRAVFAAAIYSQQAEASKVDFRASYERVSYPVYQLPAHVEQFCVHMVHSFGLAYGAIDLAVTPDGEFVFFELNGAGQYQWIEHYTNLPITETLVDLLIAGTIE
jgi:glutathione synthase/RimK-type ligase-like ATP-grasp enzyme